MTLYLNTALKDEIIIALKKGRNIIARKRMKTYHNQAEKLVPGIDNLLKSKKIKLSALKKIVVANSSPRLSSGEASGGSFTSLRIGVITANALAYALKIPVEAEEKNIGKRKKFRSYSIVEPLYDCEPSIGAPKNSGLS